jgi:folate-binding protein YgfZ
MNTPLQTALSEQPGQARPVSLAEYRGAMTAARFADPQTELSAMLTGCAVYDLGSRAKISITGNDRVRWLNGMVTNNIRDLASARGVYAFLLNPQGHILGDLYAYNRGDRVMVDTDRSQVEKALATFDHYIIMDDVEVNNLSEQFTAIGVSGPKSQSVLRAAGLQVPALEPLQVFDLRCNCNCGCVECSIVRTDDPQLESYEIWLAVADVKPLWEGLLAAGATPVGCETLETHRILSGVPLYGIDIRERDLPQETGQARALNFSKGCYIGQEIVERIRSRGNVHRTFTGFRSRTAGLISRGNKVFVDEKEVGEVTSATSLHRAGADWTIALGYIRREHVPAAGKDINEVKIGGAMAQVIQLPMRDAVFLRSLENAAVAPAAS